MVMVFVAHPDDEILGCGGTVAKYAKEGKDVECTIFSYGENSNPWLSPSYLKSQRVRESKKAGQIIGYKKIQFLGLDDNSFSKEIESPQIVSKVEKMLKSEHKIVLTHCIDDSHPAHRSVAKLIKKLIKKNRLRIKVYTFTINSPFRVIHREQPRLYIDITDTLDTKRKAIKVFKSQRRWMLYYSYLSLFNNWLAGLQSQGRFAEEFHKW